MRRKLLEFRVIWRMRIDEESMEISFFRAKSKIRRSFGMIRSAPGDVQRSSGKHEIPLGIDINKEYIFHPVLRSALYSIPPVSLSACQHVNGRASGWKGHEESNGCGSTLGLLMNTVYALLPALRLAGEERATKPAGLRASARPALAPKCEHRPLIHDFQDFHSVVNIAIPEESDRAFVLGNKLLYALRIFF